MAEHGILEGAIHHCITANPSCLPIQSITGVRTPYFSQKRVKVLTYNPVTWVRAAVLINLVALALHLFRVAGLKHNGRVPGES
jgi:hypothetical protein